MSQDTEIALRSLVGAIAQSPSIRAVGRSGGNRPLPLPGTGDIDLFVYCTEVPPAEQRAAWLEGLATDKGRIEIGAPVGRNWGVADSLLLGGVETWLMYFTVDQLWAEIRTTLRGQSVERVDNYYYPVGRLAMFQTVESLYDPDGLFQEVSSAIREYPAELMAAQLAYHLPRMHDEEDFGRAVERQDVLFYHFVLDLALDHFLQALFALNRKYFPSRKRSLEHIAEFRVKPTQCEDRLLRAVELGGRPESIADSYQIWQALTEDLSGLAQGAGG